MTLRRDDLATPGYGEVMTADQALPQAHTAPPIDSFALLDSVTDAVLLLDRDRRVAYLNRAAHRLVQPGTEPVGRRLADLFSEVHAGSLDAACRRAMAEGEPAICELHYPEQDSWSQGRAVPWAGGGVAVFLHDVTPHRLSELALRDSERRIAERTQALESTVVALRRLRERAAQLVRHMPLEIAVMEGYRGGMFRFQEVNLAFCESWGTTPEQFPGRRLRDVFPEHVALLLERRLAQCASEGRTVQFEGTIPTNRAAEAARRDQDAQRILRIILVPLPNDAPHVQHVLLTAVDLTEVRRVEAQLLQSQRMEAIGQLTGGVAHDFNNLLTVIQGSLELLDPRLTGDRERRYVRTAIDAAHRGGALTQQLLAYARRQHLAPIAMDVNAAVSGMKDMLRRTLGGMVGVQTGLASELWMATADVTQLELVILNLAINARDAMPDGGRLLIETANAAAGDGSLPTDLAPGDYVRIAVQDNGAGMSPEVLARACEPFFTTKDVGKGSGLGLAQAFGFANQLGGTVRLSSAEGVGSTVELFLPRAPDNEPEVPSGQRHLLLVDGDEELREAEAIRLRNAGYLVTTQPDGPTALAALASGTMPDMVLVDAGLRGMAANEVMRVIRLRHPAMRLAFLAASRHPALLDRLDGSVLQKPVGMEALQRILDDPAATRG